MCSALRLFEREASMTKTEAVLLATFLFLGLLESLWNAYHLTRGSLAEISRSARRQHGEMPADVDDRHYFIKAVLMLAFGVAFLGVAASILLTGEFQPLPAVLVMAALSLYGLVQAVVYRRPWRVWTAVLVYSLPLIVFALSL